MQAPSRYLPWIISLGSLIAAAGCSGTSVGNPPGAKAEVQLGIVGTGVGKQSAYMTKGNITLQEAWIAVSEIGLRDAGTCSGMDDVDAEEMVDFSGPVAADLLTGTVYPAAPMWERDADAAYCELMVSARKAGVSIAGAPADLVEYGVFVRGTRGDGTPFELRSDIQDVLDLGAPDKKEFTLEGGAVGLLLTFDINAWIDASLLNEAKPQDGIIHVDKSNNPSVGESAKEKIPKSAKLLRDRNRDGKLNEGDGEL